MSTITDTVMSGPFVFAGLLSVAAGVVSFASPCVVPLVPGYLSYLAGLVGAETATAPSVRSEPSAHDEAPATGVAAAVAVRRTARWRAVWATCLFVAGFSVVFLAESALVLGLSGAFIANKVLLMRISGVVAIVMGLVLAGAVPLLQREWRFHARPRGRVWGAPLLGAAFGTGWLACTSPTLAGILALATSTEWNGNALRGLILVVLYCAGLGIPFVLLAIGFGWAGTALAFLRRHARAIQLVGAGVLVVIGILMVTGLWGRVLAPLQQSVLVL